MNVANMLTELREEASRIDEAILALARLNLAGGKRRGRPPKWMAKPSGVTPQAPRKKATGRHAYNGR